MRSFFVRYDYSNQAKEDKLGRVRCMNRRDEECIQGFGWKARRKETIRKI
jgi:hypothetical protein